MVDDENQTDPVNDAPPVVAPETEFTAFASLLALVGDAERFAAHLAVLRKRISAATESEAALTAEENAFAQRAAEAQAALMAELEALADREVAAAQAKRALAGQRTRIAELNKAWTGFGESHIGIRAPLMDGLAKAMIAHGRKPVPEPSIDDVHFTGPMGPMEPRVFKRPAHWRVPGISCDETAAAPATGDEELPNIVGHQRPAATPFKMRKRRRLHGLFQPPGAET